MTIGKLKLKNVAGGADRLSKRKEKKQDDMQKIFNEQLKTKDKITTFQPKQGSGLIVTTGTTVIGQGTKFKAEVQNGDYLVVTNLLLQTKQQREVMLVLGDKSILLKEPFVQDIVKMTMFVIQPQAKVEKGQDITEQFKKKIEQVKKTKSISKDNTVDLRIKKGMWKYVTQKVEVKKDASREELLDLRAKKIKDKFCW